MDRHAPLFEQWETGVESPRVAAGNAVINRRCVASLCSIRNLSTMHSTRSSPSLNGRFCGGLKSVREELYFFIWLHLRLHHVARMSHSFYPKPFPNGLSLTEKTRQCFSSWFRFTSKTRSKVGQYTCDTCPLYLLCLLRSAYGLISTFWTDLYLFPQYILPYKRALVNSMELQCFSHVCLSMGETFFFQW